MDRRQSSRLVNPKVAFQPPKGYRHLGRWSYIRPNLQSVCGVWNAFDKVDATT